MPTPPPLDPAAPPAPSARAALRVVLASLLVGGAAFALAARLEHQWLQTRPFWYDALAYSYFNAELYERVQREGRWSAAARELRINDRSPLRTVPVVLLAPRVLAHPLGHLATTAPVFLLFCALLGWTIHRRTGSDLYALAGVAAFCCIRGMLNPERGMASNWLDFPASFLLGSAMLCLVNSDQLRNLRWVAGFALLGSLGALSRYVAGFYLLFAAGPVLALYLWHNWRSQTPRWPAVLKPLGVIAAIAGALALPWFLHHLRGNLGFYGSYGYVLGGSMARAAESVYICLVQDMAGPAWLTVLGGVLAVQLAAAAADRRLDLRALAVSLWLIVCVPAMLIFVLRAQDDWHVSLYTFAWAVPAALAPTPVRLAGPGPVRRTLAVALAALLAIGCLAASAPYVRQLLRAAPAPDPQTRQRKQFDRDLAQVLARVDHPVVWNCYFDEHAPKPSLEAFYLTGRLPLFAGQRYFNAHPTAWRADYPGLSDDQIADRVHQATGRWVDVAAVLADPDQALTNTYMTNPTSRLVAREMSRRLAADPAWRRLATLHSPDYGPVHVYLNTATGGRAYDDFLHRRLTP